MHANPIYTDYLVIGAGATAMAFVDSLLSEDAHAQVVMVDRNARVGGHWLHAYPFVRLHQPAAWYGVASRELASGEIETSGYNAGMHSQSSGAEVLAYFEALMNERFLPSGRVRFMPSCDAVRGADGTWAARPLAGGAEAQPIHVRRKVVDATHARTEVPATHPPKYAVAEGVRCVPLNALPERAKPGMRFTVIGSGKTGIDACLWLLQNGVAADHIRWVIPRDAWFMDRQNFQPGRENFEHNMAYNANQFEAIASARDLPDLLQRLEAKGALVRLDTAVEPTTYRCAVVSQGELAALRGIRDIVRLGRVQRIERDRLVLDRGEVAADATAMLYVDCSASAIQPLPKLPVFEGDRINLFMVRFCQPLFSAALIAWVEAHHTDAAQMNALCTPVPSPEVPADWLRMWAATLANLARWRADPALSAWLSTCRLNGAAVQLRGVRPDDAARIALVKHMGAQSALAGAAMPALLATLRQPQPA